MIQVEHVHVLVEEGTNATRAMLLATAQGVIF
jgi:hypothetical protein